MNNKEKLPAIIGAIAIAIVMALFVSLAFKFTHRPSISPFVENVPQGEFRKSEVVKFGTPGVWTYHLEKEDELLDKPEVRDFTYRGKSFTVAVKSTKLNPDELYEKRCIVKNGIYYHHSVPTDNPWLPWQYLKRLDRIKNYDRQLYGVARWGKFGAAGTRVLPQVKVAENPRAFKRHIDELGPENMYFGFDFGFEESFNAVVCMSLDTKKSVLYIWDEIYRNQITDDKFAQLPKMQKIKERIEYYNRQGYNKTIVADNEDPKAISYYRQCGFTIRACRNKFAGSRLSNTRKIKRIESIVISPKCQNTIRELRWLTYKKDAKGNVIYDEFNIDPHTFSAIWYALDMVTIADFKGREYYSKTG